MKWLAWFSVFCGAAVWASLTYHEKSSIILDEIVEWLKGFAKIPSKR